MQIGTECFEIHLSLSRISHIGLDGLEEDTEKSFGASRKRRREPPVGGAGDRIACRRPSRQRQDQARTVARDRGNRGWLRSDVAAIRLGDGSLEKVVRAATAGRKGGVKKPRSFVRVSPRRHKRAGPTLAQDDAVNFLELLLGLGAQDLAHFATDASGITRGVLNHLQPLLISVF